MSGDVQHGDDYFPALAPSGPSPAQMFKSSIEGGAESMQLMYMLSIAAATQSIDLSMAYFIPDELVTDHLVAATKEYRNGATPTGTTVDGLWVSVGSTNFDTRSFRLNDEANLNVYDRDFARRQVAQFELDLQKSRRITYEEWHGRPFLEKAWDHTVAFFGPQL